MVGGFQSRGMFGKELFGQAGVFFDTYAEMTDGRSLWDDLWVLSQAMPM